MEIVPATDTKFAKSDELQTFLLVYNAKTDKDNKPDISVEFNFHTTVGGAEKFFNKTNPQNLNAQTLPPGFDFSAGHQLQAGQAVPPDVVPGGDAAGNKGHGQAGREERDSEREFHSRCSIGPERA